MNNNPKKLGYLKIFLAYLAMGCPPIAFILWHDFDPHNVVFESETAFNLLYIASWTIGLLLFFYIYWEPKTGKKSLKRVWNNIKTFCIKHQDNIYGWIMVLIFLTVWIGGGLLLLFIPGWFDFESTPSFIMQSFGFAWLFLGWAGLKSL